MPLLKDTTQGKKSYKKLFKSHKRLCSQLLNLALGNEKTCLLDCL